MLREYLRRPTMARYLFLVTLAVVGVILLVKVPYLLDDEPYRMSLKPFQGRGKVQFFEPGRRYASAEFDVEYPFQTTHVIILDSQDVAIPGGVIEFFDGSPMPGRIKIRFGATLFDIMEAHLFVNERYYDWGNL